MGEWEQKRFRPGECKISEAECKAFFTNAFYFSGCPNRENIQEVCNRTQEFLKELAAKPEYQDKTVLVATHGLELRAMLNFLYEDKIDYWHGHVTYNCAVNIIEVHDGQCKLIAADDKIHYDEGMCADGYAKS